MNLNPVALENLQNAAEARQAAAVFGANAHAQNEQMQRLENQMDRMDGRLQNLQRPARQPNAINGAAVGAVVAVAVVGTVLNGVAAGINAGTHQRQVLADLHDQHERDQMQAAEDRRANVRNTLAQHQDLLRTPPAHRNVLPTANMMLVNQLQVPVSARYDNYFGALRQRDKQLKRFEDASSQRETNWIMNSSRGDACSNLWIDNHLKLALTHTKKGAQLHIAEIFRHNIQDHFPANFRVFMSTFLMWATTRLLVEHRVPNAALDSVVVYGIFDESFTSRSSLRALLGTETVLKPKHKQFGTITTSTGIGKVICNAFPGVTKISFLPSQPGCSAQMVLHF